MSRPLILALALVIALAASAAHAGEGAARSAQPISLPGTKNLYKVSDTLYRSAQPDAEGFRNLKELGIVTVVNLRSYHSDRDEIGDTGLGYEHLYMKAWHPERKELMAFLRIATDPKRQPVLVHCQHGSDRTGAMVAAYRIVVQGWEKKDAVAELTSEQYGFHKVWKNLPSWVLEFDVNAIREELGIKVLPAP